MARPPIAPHRSWRPIPAPPLAALLIGLAAPARAQEGLPPDHPTVAFTVEYRMDRNRGGQFQWGLRRLAVDGPRLRDELIDGDLDTATLIVDLDRGIALSFEPDDPAHLVRRQKLGIDRDRVLPAMAQGYAATMRLLGPPLVLGERDIAGQRCTRLVWETVAERQEWCVSDQGVALFARRQVGVQETRVEATRLLLAPPDPGQFALPAGFAEPD